MGLSQNPRARATKPGCKQELSHGTSSRGQNSALLWDVALLTRKWPGTAQIPAGCQGFPGCPVPRCLFPCKEPFPSF